MGGDQERSEMAQVAGSEGLQLWACRQVLKTVCPRRHADGARHCLCSETAARVHSIADHSDGIPLKLGWHVAGETPQVVDKLVCHLWVCTSVGGVPAAEAFNQMATDVIDGVWNEHVGNSTLKVLARRRT